MDNEWISVKTKLPDNASPILVWQKMLFGQIKTAFFIENEFHSCAYNHDNITKWVTHWMPLP